MENTLRNRKLELKEIINGKVAVFIDAANMLYSQQSLGWKIDYKKLKDFIETQAETVGFFYYTGKVGTLEKQLGFIKRLEKLDYTVVAKEVKMIRISSEKYLPKGNLDIELALDAYRLQDTYETLLLFSGDSDFAYLLDLLKQTRKHVIVFSTRGHIAKELIERAKYIDLKMWKSKIAWLDGAKKIRSPKAPEV